MSILQTEKRLYDELKLKSRTPFRVVGPINFEAWGKWHRQGGGFRELWYPTQSAHDDIRARGGIPIASMADEEAMAIERAALALKQSDKERFTALAIYYIENVTERALAKRLRIGQTKAKQLLKSAEAFIEGVLAA